MPSLEVIYSAVKALRMIGAQYPAAAPLLSAKARYIVAVAAPDMAMKDAEDITRRMAYLIDAVYSGVIGGGFIDAMAALVSRQMTLAYQAAWDDEGGGSDGEPMPDYLTQAADQAAIDQFDFVDGLYKDIVDAKVDQTGTDQFDSRIDLWSNRYNEAYNDGILKIKLDTGGNLQWVEGDTMVKCRKCLALDGLVASAKDWDELNVHPQGGPNPALANNSGDKNDGCEGWRCNCKLQPTDQRRSPNVRQTIIDIVSS